MGNYITRPDLLETGKSLFGADLICVQEEDRYDPAGIYEGGIAIGTANTMRFIFSDGRAFEIGVSEWGSIIPIQTITTVP